MKNMMKKNTFREIKGSFSRWLAILAIVALGVGFFCGLKVCKEAFVLTGNQYIEEHNLFDYQLISTLGIEKKDVKTISALKGVKYAQGSYSQDALISLEDEDLGESVAKVQTISDKINTLSLLDGRLPERDDECIGDSHRFTSADIGKTVYICDDNDKDTIDMFSCKEFTLVGIAQSPLYLNFERGSTSLGDGSVSCFLFIPESAWDSEVYTEMYVDLEDDAPIFSDEYKDIIDRIKTPLTEAFEDCASDRYDEIISDANEELEKAEKKVADGEDELNANEKKLADSQRDLDKAEKDYNQGVKDYTKEKEQAYAQLDEMLAQIAPLEGTPYYEESYNQYLLAKETADKKFQEAWDKLEEGKNKISEGRRKITEGKDEIAKAKTKIADAKEELDDARDEISKIEHPTTYVLSRNTNVGYACFENDSKIVDSIAKVFPLFFFLVAALVCMTTMTRMIDEQRTQIGVLKALGYGKNQILWKYVFYSGSAALIGGLGGFIGGSYLFPWVIWQAYGIMYGFADLTIVINWTLGVLSILVALLCCLGATIYCCYSELSEVPAQLIRPKAPAAGKRILLERIPFIWNRLKFLRKVSLRNIFRYKKRFFMMVLGICGCTALLVTGMGIGDSIANVVSSQYDEIHHYDYTVSFDRDISQTQQDKFLKENKSVISECLFLYTGSVDAHVGEQVKSVNLVVCSDKDRDSIPAFIDLHSGDKTVKYPSTGEGVINSNLAGTLGINIGDTLTVYDSDMREMSVKITDFCDNYVYNYLYITDSTYKEQWGHSETNSAYVLGIKNEDGVVENPHEDGAYLMNAKRVSSVTITQDIRDRINNMMKSLDYVIALVVACAGTLAFIVLYNLTNINITERIREIATIKVLGFYPGETSAYVFRENVVLTAISALVGLPLGKLLHAFVMSQIKIDLLSFDIHIELTSYIISVIATFAFAMIVNFVMYFRLNRISMTESLKSIE